MRYYRIEITKPDGGAVRSWSSLANGKNDPGALNIEIDAFVTMLAAPAQYAFLRISGVSLQDIGQAADLNIDKHGHATALISVYAGMSAGLPLANPQQAGLILQGFILQAFGNWQGTEMSLDLVVAYNGVKAKPPANIVLNWQAGTKLADALASTISTAYPNVKQTIAISPQLVLNHTETGYYETLTQFAGWLKAYTPQIVGGDYPGVDIVLNPNSILVTDATTQAAPKQLAFTDLIGQPTWIAPQEIIIKTVMRADIAVGDFIRMPQGLSAQPGAVVTQPHTYANYRNSSAFQGAFFVKQMRHVGNFRQPDGSSWVTVFNATTTTAAVS